MNKANRILNNFRLALFPMAYALSGVLIGSTLNRIMIADLEYPASLVAVFFAIPLLVSPIRVWIGYRSDGFAILGKRREPYIILGSLLIGAGVYLIAQLIITGSSAGTLIAIGLAFILYGLGRNISHNTFQALVSERYQGETRSRAATFYEVATMIGMIIGAGVIKGALKVYDPSKLTGLALGVAVTVLILTVLASVRQEAQNAILHAAMEKSRKVNFGTAFRHIVIADPQIRLFFIIVVLTFVGTLAQDVLLEPYGGLVLKMEVGETTGLTQFWGIGVLLSMLASGFFLLKKFGHLHVMRAGMILSIIAFTGPIIAGFIGNIALFKGMVFVMGLGTGLSGAGMLSGVMSYTTRVRAGMLLGVWGVANMTGHAFGSIIGGLLVDSVRAISGSSLFAYSAVFLLEMAFLAVAVSLSTRLKVEKTIAVAEEYQSLAFLESSAD